MHVTVMSVTDCQFIRQSAHLAVCHYPYRLFSPRRLFLSKRSSPNTKNVREPFLMGELLLRRRADARSEVNATHSAAIPYTQRFHTHSVACDGDATHKLRQMPHTHSDENPDASMFFFGLQEARI